MDEGYARVSGHVSASSPEKLPLKRNAGIDELSGRCHFRLSISFWLVGRPNEMICEDAVHEISER